MTIMRLGLPVTLLTLALLVSQAFAPVRFGSPAHATESGGGGVGANEVTFEIIDPVTFRRNLARLSTREGRRYAQNLLRRTSEATPGSVPVIEGFTRFESQDLFAMASANPSGTERLLRQLDRVTDRDARLEILRRAQTDAQHTANLTADERTAHRNNPRVERRDRQAINRRARYAAMYLRYINRWIRNPEMGTGTMPRDRAGN
ncbi:MAG: hypothetical protein K8F25_09890 [Fimbriimonadaceae bacterium]|nr:hypothetical protein [Alphaproteobacteria bacterium]